SIDPGERIIDTEMAGMGRIAQAVNNPEVEVFQQGPALARDVAEIGRVGGVADAKPERWNPAVLEKEGRQRYGTALPFDGAALGGLDRAMFEDGRIITAGWRDEAVGKPGQDFPTRGLVEIDRDAPALMHHD